MAYSDQLVDHYENPRNVGKFDIDKTIGTGMVGAAGTRVRKHLQELAKLCKETRNDVTAVKNARKEAK